jgi:hypothetical protein
MENPVPLRIVPLVRQAAGSADAPDVPGPPSRHGTP